MTRQTILKNTKRTKLCLHFQLNSLPYTNTLTSTLAISRIATHLPTYKHMYLTDKTMLEKHKWLGVCKEISASLMQITQQTNFVVVT